FGLLVGNESERRRQFDHTVAVLPRFSKAAERIAHTREQISVVGSDGLTAPTPDAVPVVPILVRYELKCLECLRRGVDCVDRSVVGSRVAVTCRRIVQRAAVRT